MKGITLPPGNYTFVLERVRKVRNKPYYRMHMRIVGGPEDGTHVTQIMRKD